MRARRRHATAFLSLGMALTGCGGTDDLYAARTSTLVVHDRGHDEWMFSPSQADEPMYLVFLPLARQGPTGEIEGQLIHSWEQSDDHRHWIIRLRTDVRWHDGVPVTAHDVEFTADLLMHPDVSPMSACVRAGRMIGKVGAAPVLGCGSATAESRW